MGLDGLEFSFTHPFWWSGKLDLEWTWAELSWYAAFQTMVGYLTRDWKAVGDQGSSVGWQEW